MYLINVDKTNWVTAAKDGTGIVVEEILNGAAAYFAISYSWNKDEENGRVLETSVRQGYVRIYCDENKTRIFIPANSILSIPLIQQTIRFKHGQTLKYCWLDKFSSPEAHNRHPDSIHPHLGKRYYNASRVVVSPTFDVYDWNQGMNLWIGSNYTSTEFARANQRATVLVMNKSGELVTWDDHSMKEFYAKIAKKLGFV